MRRLANVSDLVQPFKEERKSTVRVKSNVANCENVDAFPQFWSFSLETSLLCRCGHGTPSGGVRVPPLERKSTVRAKSIVTKRNSPDCHETLVNCCAQAPERF